MGINIIGTPTYINKKNHDKYFVNALLLFLSVYGSITYLLSAMDVDYYGFILMPFIAAISLGCSFIHRNKKSMIIGYILVLGIYGLYVLGTSEIINSGFSHCLNILYQRVDERYVLGIDKEYAETFSNSTLAVTMLGIAGGFALALVINMLIAESMNGFAIAFLEMLFLIIPFYFGYEGSTLSLFMVIVVPVAVMVIKGTHKFGLHDNDVSYRNQPPKNLVMKAVDKVKPESKKSFENRYTRKGYFKCRVMPQVVARQLVVVSMIAAGIVLAGRIAVPYSATNGVGNPVEQTLKGPVQEFAMYGFEAFWKKGSVASDGIMDGSIYDGGYIRFDYQTDLKLTYTASQVPDDRILLKGYTGAYYTGKAWLNTKEWSQYEGKDQDVHGLGYFLANRYKVSESEKNFLIDEMTNSTAAEMERLSEQSLVNHFSMTITNVGSPRNNIYCPYYTLMNEIYEENDGNRNINKSYNDYDGDGTVDATVGFDKTLDIRGVNAADLQAYESAHVASEYESIYSSYVEKTFMDNTAVSSYVAQQFMKEYNLEPVYGNADKDIYYKVKGFDLKNELAAVDEIQQIFDTDYTYTLVPGKTPQGWDYAEYFLLETKKGYCVHFATSAIMVLRQMGIPARYCEGYAFDPDCVWSAEKKEDDQGNECWEVKASITDEYGHAWIEIYADGVGWVPIDITPAAEEEEEVEEQSPSRIATIFNGIAGGASVAGGTIAAMLGIVAGNKMAILILAVTIAIVFIVVWILSIYIAHLIRMSRMKNKDNNKAIIAIAEYARKLLRMGGFDKREIYTFMECANKARSKGEFELADAISILEPIQKLVYGNRDVKQNERENAYEALRSLSRCIYNSLKWYKKIVFLLIKRMTVVK